MAVRIETAQSPQETYKGLIEKGNYDDAWHLLENRIGDNRFVAECIQITIDQAHEVLNEGAATGLPNQRPWVMEALRCCQIAFQGLRMIPPESSWVSGSYNRLFSRINAFPAYQEWIQQGQPTQTKPSSGIPNTLSGSNGDTIEFCQSNDCVKIVFRPNEPALCAPSDGRRGGAPRGDIHTLYFKGKLEEVPTEKKKVIFQLFQHLAHHKKLFLLQSYYIKEFRNKRNIIESENIDNLIAMLRFQIHYDSILNPLGLAPSESFFLFP
ncbi:MAG: hypothetical protein K1X28_10240 [Parachlamydiales bacterium]|nr:hypothetical protein [Parachlamydiales bacterium]